MARRRPDPELAGPLAAHEDPAEEGWQLLDARIEVARSLRRLLLLLSRLLARLLPAMETQQGESVAGEQGSRRRSSDDGRRQRRATALLSRGFLLAGLSAAVPFQQAEPHEVEADEDWVDAGEYAAEEEVGAGALDGDAHGELAAAAHPEQQPQLEGIPPEVLYLGAATGVTLVAMGMLAVVRWTRR